MKLEPKDFLNKYLIMEMMVVQVLRVVYVEESGASAEIAEIWGLEYIICTGKNKGMIESQEFWVFKSWDKDYIFDDLAIAVLGMTRWDLAHPSRPFRRGNIK